MLRDQWGFPRRGIEAIENSARPERINTTFGKCRRGARAGAGLAIRVASLILMRPDFLTAGGVEAYDHLELASLLLREQPVSDDYHRRPGGSNAVPPELFRPLGAPVRGNRDAVHFAFSIRPAKLRPIAAAVMSTPGPRRQPVAASPCSLGRGGPNNRLPPTAPTPRYGDIVVAPHAVHAHDRLASPGHDEQSRACPGVSRGRTSSGDEQPHQPGGQADRGPKSMTPIGPTDGSHKMAASPPTDDHGDEPNSRSAADSSIRQPPDDKQQRQQGRRRHVRHEHAGNIQVQHVRNSDESPIATTSTTAGHSRGAGAESGGVCS